MFRINIHQPGILLTHKCYIHVPYIPVTAKECTSASHYLKLGGFPARNFRSVIYAMKIYLIVALLVYFYFLLNPGRAMSQKALLLRKVGTPLVLGDRPIPQPGQNRLLVKVLVAGREFDK